MTHETHEKQQSNITMVLVVLLVLNVLLTLYVGFFKRDALWLETLKAGGTENMNLANQLYNSDVYKQQQKATLDQILGSMNKVTEPTVQPTPTPAE